MSAATGRRRSGSSAPSGCPRRVKRARCSPTKRPCPSRAATAWTCCRRPRPTSPPSGGSRSPRACRRAQPAGEPEIDVYDDDGVRHELWVVHRAEGGGDRRGRRRRTGRHRRRPPPLRDGPDLPAPGPGRTAAAPGGHDWVMALIVELVRGAARSRPIHRVIIGLGPARPSSSRPSSAGSTWSGRRRDLTGWPPPSARPPPSPSSRARTRGCSPPSGGPTRPPSSDLDSSVGGPGAARGSTGRPDVATATAGGGRRGGPRPATPRRPCSCARRRSPRSPSGRTPRRRMPPRRPISARSPGPAWSSARLGTDGALSRPSRSNRTAAEPRGRRRRAAPGPGRSGGVISSPYSGRSTARKTPIGSARAGRWPAGTGRGAGRDRRGLVVDQQGVLAHIGDVHDLELAVGALHDPTLPSAPKRIGSPWTERDEHGRPERHDR